MHSNFITRTGGQHQVASDADLSRLATNGRTFLHTTTLQASFTIAAEVERRKSGPHALHTRSDLSIIIEEAEAFTLRTLEAGETNIKPHLLLSILSAEMNGRASERGDELRMQQISDGSTDALVRCLNILERKAEELEGLGAAAPGEGTDLSFGAPEAPLEDWDFLVS